MPNCCVVKSDIVILYFINDVFMIGYVPQKIDVGCVPNTMIKLFCPNYLTTFKSIMRSLPIFIS